MSPRWAVRQLFGDACWTQRWPSVLSCSLSAGRIADDSLHTGGCTRMSGHVERMNQVHMDRADRGVEPIIPRVLL